MNELVFLKLGGSLITDKTRPETARVEWIHRLAAEVCQVLALRPELGLLLGHGSGSFGHQAAARHGTRQGVRVPAQWRGYAEVAAAAARLNRLVSHTFRSVGVPVLSVQPSASARCRDGLLVDLALAPLESALAHGLVPLVYGDVALDEMRGGTIVSTEDLFVYLAPILQPQRLLLVGQTRGVLDEDGATIPRITPATLPSIRPLLTGSHAVDVTGGMADKVTRMVDLVQRQPGLVVQILSGLEEGALLRALLEPEYVQGTEIGK